MSQTNDTHCFMPFTPDSSLATGLHVLASLGNGPPRLSQVDTGSVGILVPRRRLGPEHQVFNPSDDTEIRYASSGKTYWAQWVRLPAVLGVPATCDGSGSCPIAQVEVFAVDQPAAFDGGVLGIGFAIGGSADGGRARNALLHLTYPGAKLGPGYIITSQGLDAGLSSSNAAGFAFVALNFNPAVGDWIQPRGSLSLPGGFNVDLPILLDTGIAEMLPWLKVDDRPRFGGRFVSPRYRGGHLGPGGGSDSRASIARYIYHGRSEPADGALAGRMARRPRHQHGQERVGWR